jgi:hypothetical protein
MSATEALRDAAFQLKFGGEIYEAAQNGSDGFWALAVENGFKAGWSAALAAAPAGGAEPVAWMYTLWFGDEAVRQVAFCYRFDLAVASPFGREGIDFAADGKIEEQPLYAAPTAQPQPAYSDSTSGLHIGDSAFEDWYQSYCVNIPANPKQAARDAYAAGMGDPLVMARAPAAQPTLLNGLTEQETAASASVAGLSGAQPEAPAEPSALEVLRHTANEWADMASNGLQWLRNIRDGVSTVEDALSSMLRDYAHCREVNDAPAACEARRLTTSAPAA